MGSNQGDREDHLMRAREMMETSCGNLLRSSSIIETEAWGFSGSAFLNQVVVLATELAPLELLDRLQEIERALGRTQKTVYVEGRPVYHNRPIDLDILDYDHMIYHDERLTLPHPQIRNREFVLRSLRELHIDLFEPNAQSLL